MTGVRLFIVAVVCCFWVISGAQSYSQAGIIPSFLLRQKFNSAWSGSLAFSSEALVTEDRAADRVFSPEVLNLNIQGVASYDWTPELDLDLGLLLRRVDPFNGVGHEIRPFQQLTWMLYVGKYRLRHRVRLEERIFNGRGMGSEVDWRMRYRFSVDFPLSGDRLDPKEFYFNSSSEALIQLDRAAVFEHWDSRTYLGLGYVFEKKNRLEVGLEYRTRERGGGLRSNLFFMRVVWVQPVEIVKVRPKDPEN